MQIGQRVAAAGMVVSGGLALVKILAGVAGHSTSVVADGLESTGDVFASGLVLLGLTLGARPADWNHPYGHGRFEILTGLLLGVALSGAGALVCYRSLLRVAAAPAIPAPFVIWPLIASAVFKTGLFALKRHYGRRLRSAALLADAWNDGVDILSAIVAFSAVVLTLHNPVDFRNADNYGGAAVGLILIFTGMRIVRDTALQLMDTMPDESLISEIRHETLNVAGVRGVEKCFARKTGSSFHVDLHLEVDPEITVRESHAIAKAVKNHLKQRLAWVADVLVHVEPAP